MGNANTNEQLRSLNNRDNDDNNNKRRKGNQRRNWCRIISAFPERHQIHHPNAQLSVFRSGIKGVDKSIEWYHSFFPPRITTTQLFSQDEAIRSVHHSMLPNTRTPRVRVRRERNEDHNQEEEETLRMSRRPWLGTLRLGTWRTWRMVGNRRTISLFVTCDFMFCVTCVLCNVQFFVILCCCCDVVCCHVLVISSLILSVNVKEKWCLNKSINV